MTTDKHTNALCLADELRRLYAENEALKEQRDELVRALLPFATIGSGFDMDDVLKARAAIAKATGD